MLRTLRQTRVRLTAAVTAVFVAVAAVAAVAVWLTFSRLEYRDLDSSLAAQSQAVVGGLQDSNGHVTLQGGDPLPAQTSTGIAVGATLFDAGGRVLDTSGSASPADALRPVALSVARSGASTAATVATAAGDVRALATAVDAGGGRGALVVTRPLGELERTLGLLGALLAGTVTLLAVVASVLAYVLAGRALRPVRVIAATARQISDDDLHRRITLDLPEDELGELAATFNGMLERLEGSFSALQQFTADAAHELRAPLALLRAELEVSLSRARTPAEYRATQRVALAEVIRLARTADQLLLLARADAGALRPELAPLDVGDLVDEAAARWSPLAEQRRIRVRVQPGDDGEVVADRELLRRVLDNLVDNAVRHSPSGGTVSITASRDVTGWDLTVEDDGEGVPPSLRDGLFDRFTRGDAARGRDTGGAGLGLSLCRVVAEMHGGWIRLEEDGRRPGARFHLHLPGAPAR